MGKAGGSMNNNTDIITGHAGGKTSGGRNSIWIDVTGILRWGAQPPTGIQRVEQTIYKYAAAQEGVGIAYFDKGLGTYVPITPKAKAFIDFIVSGSFALDNPGYRERLAVTYAFLSVQAKFQGNETSRRLASALAGGRRRKGFPYEAVKIIVRTTLWMARLAEFVFGMARMPFQDFLRGNSAGACSAGDIILMSHDLARSKRAARACRRKSQTPVRVIYDLIPISNPEFVTRRFSASLLASMRKLADEPEPLIAISNTVRDDIDKWCQQETGAAYRLTIKVCGLNSPMPDDASRDEPIEHLSGKPFVLFCSTMEVRKRHDILVAAWARLARKFGPDTLPELVFIGRSTSGRPAIDAELAKAPEIGGKVHMLTGLGDNQLRWAYRNAMLGLFPSSQEGWGLGVSECLAYGLPVIHSDIPVLHEAAQDTMPAAPVGDVDAWTEILASHLASPEKIKALREKIRTGYEPGEPDGFARCIVSHLRMIAEGGVDSLRNEDRVRAG